MSLTSTATKTVIAFAVVAYVAGDTAAASLGSTAGTAVGHGVLATIELVRSGGQVLQDGNPAGETPAPNPAG